MSDDLAFGSPDAILYPPEAAELLAESDCRWCGWSGSTFVWPLKVTLASALRRIEKPIAKRRDTCPECGERLDAEARRQHPSSG